MQPTAAHPAPPDLPALWEPMVSPVVTEHPAKMENPESSHLHPLVRSRRADPARLVPRVLPVPLDPLARPDLLDAPDPTVEMATPVALEPTELAARPDPREPPARTVPVVPPASPVPVESRATPDPRDPPATVDPLDLLVHQDPTATPDPRDSPVPLATLVCPETMVSPASPVPLVSPDPPARMPNTVLALLVVLAAGAKSSGTHHRVLHDIM